MLRSLALSTLLITAGEVQAEINLSLTTYIENTGDMEITSPCEQSVTTGVAFPLDAPAESGEAIQLLYLCTLNEGNEVYVNFLFLPNGNVDVEIAPFRGQAQQE